MLWNRMWCNKAPSQVDFVAVQDAAAARDSEVERDRRRLVERRQIAVGWK
ncbi:hypothetical protein VTH06DRAFT_4281 [Thermothelomyces fergusii]